MLDASGTIITTSVPCDAMPIVDTSTVRIADVMVCVLQVQVLKSVGAD